MRCKACDALLEPEDLRRKSAALGDFIDLCTPCFETIKDEVDVVTKNNGKVGKE